MTSDPFSLAVGSVAGLLAFAGFVMCVHLVGFRAGLVVGRTRGVVHLAALVVIDAAASECEEFRAYGKAMAKELEKVKSK